MQLLKATASLFVGKHTWPERPLQPHGDKDPLWSTFGFDSAGFLSAVDSACALRARHCRLLRSMGTWQRDTHHLFPPAFRRVVFTLLCVMRRAKAEFLLARILEFVHPRSWVYQAFGWDDIIIEPAGMPEVSDEGDEGDR